MDNKDRYRIRAMAADAQASLDLLKARDPDRPGLDHSQKAINRLIELAKDGK